MSLFAFILGVFTTCSTNAVTIQVDTLSSVGKEIQLAAIGSADSFSWNMGDGTVITGVANPTYMYLIPGAYQVVVTSYRDSCNELDSVTIDVKEPTGIVEPPKGRRVILNYYTFCGQEIVPFGPPQLYLMEVEEEGHVVYIKTVR